MKRCIIVFLSFVLCSSYWSDMVKAINSAEIISVSPATGQLNYTLPLYTISDPDFQWPISISYTSDGFRPFDYSFPMGHGWNLCAEGTISREIVDLADDLDALPGSSPYSYDRGFLYHIRHPEYTGEYRDYGSDIYTFSFGTHSGTII